MNILLVWIPMIAFFLWKVHKRNKSLKEFNKVFEQIKPKWQLLNNILADSIEKSKDSIEKSKRK